MKVMLGFILLLLTATATAQGGWIPPGFLYPELKQLLIVDTETGTVCEYKAVRGYINGEGKSASVAVKGNCTFEEPVVVGPTCDPDSPQVGPCLPEPEPEPEPEVDCDGPYAGPVPPAGC